MTYVGRLAISGPRHKFDGKKENIKKNSRRKLSEILFFLYEIKNTNDLFGVDLNLKINISYS